MTVLERITTDDLIVVGMGEACTPDRTCIICGAWEQPRRSTAGVADPDRVTPISGMVVCYGCIVAGSQDAPLRMRKYASELNGWAAALNAASGHRFHLPTLGEWYEANLIRVIDANSTVSGGTK